MRWMHRVRLYPKASQEERLRFMLDVTRQTFIALLDERRYAWKTRGINVRQRCSMPRSRRCVPKTPDSPACTASAWTRCGTGSIWRLRRSSGASSAASQLAIRGLSRPRAGSSWSFRTATALDVRRMTLSAKGTLATPGRNVAAKSGLNRALLDAGFGKLAMLIREQAAWAVREIVSIDARYSSQTCGRCLQVDAKSRRRRRFCCVACGWTCHADVAAALEIRRRAELQRMSVLPRARTPLTSQDAA
jgi:hypothetical protein